MTVLTYPRRAVEPDGTVHAARYAGSRTAFTTACAVYPAPTVDRLELTGDRLVTCTGCLAAVPVRCPAAHPQDPAPCGGPVVVTVLDSGNAGADGCELHAARLLASLEGGRVYALPHAPDRVAIRVYTAAGNLRPFDFGPAPAPRPAEPAAVPLMVYRAEHDTIPLGTYTNLQAAYAQCEDLLRRTDPHAPMCWDFPYGEDDDDLPAVLCLFLTGADGDWIESGYAVVTVTVASAYNPDADE